MKKFIDWIIKRNNGVVVRFEFKGDKGRDQIHSRGYLHFVPSEDEFIINWDTKTVEKQKRK